MNIESKYQVSIVLHLTRRNEKLCQWQYTVVHSRDAGTDFRHAGLEFVTGGVELLKAVLHGYAGGLIFMK